MMMFPYAPMPQLICPSPQTVSGLVDSLTQFINRGMMDAAANIAQFLARCSPPCQPPHSKPHVCPLEFPAPKPRRRQRRRRRRPRTSCPLPSSFDSILSTEVDEVIRSIEQLPVAKSTNQEEKRFRKFDMLRMCKTIDVLAKMYSPNHPQRRNPPPLAIEHQSQSQECAKAEATTPNVQSALQPLPNIVIPNVADMVKSGMKNLLAIAAATEINFKEAKTMKTALADTEPMLAKNERGHVTGAESTLSPAPQPPDAADNVQVEELISSEVSERQLAVSFPTPENQTELGEPQQFSIKELRYDESADTFSCGGHHVVFANPEVHAEVLARLQEKQEERVEGESCATPPPCRGCEEGDQASDQCCRLDNIPAKPEVRSLCPPEPADLPCQVRDQLKLAHQVPVNFRLREPELSYGKLSQRAVRNLARYSTYEEDVGTFPPPRYMLNHLVDTWSTWT